MEGKQKQWRNKEDRKAERNSKESEEERKETETLGMAERTNKVRNRAKQTDGRRIGTKERKNLVREREEKREKKRQVNARRKSVNCVHLVLTPSWVQLTPHKCRTVLITKREAGRSCAQKHLRGQHGRNTYNQMMMYCRLVILVGS